MWNLKLINNKSLDKCDQMNRQLILMYSGSTIQQNELSYTANFISECAMTMWVKHMTVLYFIYTDNEAQAFFQEFTESSSLIQLFEKLVSTWR